MAEDIIGGIVGSTHPSKLVCAKIGTILNPVRVHIRSHERAAMVYRYIVYKGLEMAVKAVLTRGMPKDMDTVGDKAMEMAGIKSPDFAVELALRQGLELALKGEVEKNQWFYLEGERHVLYYRDADGDISAKHTTQDGATVGVPKSSTTKFVDDQFKLKQEKEDFLRALKDGRAT